MRALTKLAYPLAVLATLAFAAAPAHAQFEGAGDQVTQYSPMYSPMLEQFAPMMEQAGPMMEMMKGKIGKKRMGQIMQMVGPMMAGMAGSGGGDFGMAGMPGMMGYGASKGARPRNK